MLSEMSYFAAFLAVVNLLLIFYLPTKWASLPLLIGACYMPLEAWFKLGPFHFSYIRIIILSGIIRVFFRREKISGEFNILDKTILISGCWALFTSFFYENFSGALTFRLGFFFNTCGIYFLLRVFCKNIDEIINLCRVAAILLMPVAIEMIYEKLTFTNLFSIFGSANKAPNLRFDTIRANGPFAHAILAGTVGACSMPLMFGLWKQHRYIAIGGILACLIMIVTSASSGPILSALVGIMALCLFSLQGKMRTVRIIGIIGYFALHIFMNAPAYYLIGRIDLTGGSTGWHRARLIETSLEHLSEWWLAGTSYTRHWMPTGVSWSLEHTDITNHYLYLGVMAGLPLTLLFMLTLGISFSFIGKALKKSNTNKIAGEKRFFLWTIGSALFAHAVTFISVSYFDQSFVFIYFLFAAISTLSKENISHYVDDSEAASRLR
jgi:hypothetical protein